MWGIENPFEVFSYIEDIKKPKDKKPTIIALISEQNFISFPEESQEKLSKYFKNVKVKDPNNPSQLIESVLIKIVK